MPIDPTLCPAIFGVSGTSLTDRERVFFEKVKPFGFILFARNIADPDQVRALVDSLRPLAAVQPCPVLIDQEGGRVARLRPPHWPAYPRGAVFGKLFDVDPDNARRALYLNSRLIAADLHDLGINIDCLPVLDIPARGGHEVIGDRAYARSASTVAALGREACAGLIDGGVLPVIKHIPGHGRASADTHIELPVVATKAATLRRTDFAPFKALRDAPFAMTAHVIYADLDPHYPATTSRAVIDRIIRKTIGFDGVLMSDDLNMQALSGTLAERAFASQQAGCDLALHCNGDYDDMVAVAGGLERASPATLRRLKRAMGFLAPPRPFDRDAGVRERDALLARAET
ncbi:beta-N-acetylhexosaminidase [Emcibacter sp. SYSU 3D8]|uniref:beta-N-acetylhexosaminidase n=1 Tax=Emcibacter sp. SYSU 3D8 TaxID=3133969 RepID=UPI0031FE68D0